ncbi:MAG: hypothetical protein KY456_11170 [Chloroflexi bacterium]|nr:hypothetical protein [Chloroflexota bacterium]
MDLRSLAVALYRKEARKVVVRQLALVEHGPTQRGHIERAERKAVDPARLPAGELDFDVLPESEGGDAASS